MTSAPSRLDTLAGPALRPLLPALARLRSAVFREWPYLYDGTEEYEQRYLAAYAESPGAAVVVASDGDGQPVGAATCQPMAEAAAPVQDAFRAGGLDPARFCYFGESVLLPPHRGRGLGVGFFAAREAHARALGLDHAAFCAVVRNANDPRKPPGYQPLDGFWRRRGYIPRPDLSCVFHWREVGDDRETPHSLSFWLKSLVAGAPMP
jgi:GNAT superfamily N-acetyltransferase